MKIWLTLLLAALTLSGCAGTPTNTDNVCAVFDQRGGWFNNWYKYAKNTEKEYGVPVPVLMATIYKESGFNAKARPPRTKLLGFIPWKRPSSAYGYPQALDGTHGTGTRTPPVAVVRTGMISRMRCGLSVGTTTRATKKTAWPGTTPITFTSITTPATAAMPAVPGKTTSG